MLKVIASIVLLVLTIGLMVAATVLTDEHPYAGFVFVLVGFVAIFVGANIFSRGMMELMGPSDDR